MVVVVVVVVVPPYRRHTVRHRNRTVRRRRPTARRRRTVCRRRTTVQYGRGTVSLLSRTEFEPRYAPKTEFRAALRNFVLISACMTSAFALLGACP